uniref:Uncharacterized protein n=1 Tax=Kangiella spongicola TaxID=796379 RepID=A0A318D3J8_9GAMM
MIRLLVGRIFAHLKKVDEFFFANMSFILHIFQQGDIRDCRCWNLEEKKQNCWRNSVNSPYTMLSGM